MPIYEYECEKCGHRAEILQKFSDPPLTECDVCHGRMKKLISQSTFHLKGTGWYVTDYAAKSPGSGRSSHAGDSQKDKSASSDKPGKTEVKASSDESGKGGASKSAD